MDMFLSIQNFSCCDIIAFHFPFISCKDSFPFLVFHILSSLRTWLKVHFLQCLLVPEPDALLGGQSNEKCFIAYQDSSLCYIRFKGFSYGQYFVSDLF